MAEKDHSHIYFQGPPSAFTTVGSAPADITSNPSTNPDDAFQIYFDEISWPYQETDTINPAASIGPSQSNLMASSWGFDMINQQTQPFDEHSFVQASSYSAELPRYSQSRSAQSTSRLASQAPLPNTLPPAAQEQLRNMPDLQYKSPMSASSPGSAESWANLGSSESPDHNLELSKGSSKKRKIIEEDEEDDEDEDEGKPMKKSAHNMIEKRYRTNLNDKIVALCESVPSLRILSKTARGEDITEDREELHGLKPAHKLNKATIFSKATEYIRHLEKRNNLLTKELDTVRRIAAFEKPFMDGAMNGSATPDYRYPLTPIPFNINHQIYQNQATDSPESTAPVAGAIQYQDDVKRAVPSPIAAGQSYPVAEVQGGPGNILQQ